MNGIWLHIKNEELKIKIEQLRIERTLTVDCIKSLLAISPEV